MSQEDEGFVLEEDPSAIKYLFGGKQDVPEEENFVTIRSRGTEPVAKRVTAPTQREAPSFPKKEVERDIITFTPSRPRGAVARFIREKTSVAVISIVSIALLVGIGTVVYVVISNYWS